MTGFIYIAKSEKSNRYYIGSTNCPERRILEHNAGKTESLRGHIPVKIVFQQEYPSLIDARRMELRLKKMKSRVILDAIVRDQKIKSGL
jgi:putative endonuclease